MLTAACLTLLLLAFIIYEWRLIRGEARNFDRYGDRN